jgi:hypothetical protein
MPRNVFLKNYRHRAHIVDNNKITQITNNFLMKHNYFDIDIKKETRKPRLCNNQKAFISIALSNYTGMN